MANSFQYGNVKPITDSLITDLLIIGQRWVTLTQILPGVDAVGVAITPHELQCIGTHSLQIIESNAVIGGITHLGWIGGAAHVGMAAFAFHAGADSTQTRKRVAAHAPIFPGNRQNSFTFVGFDAGWSHLTHRYQSLFKMWRIIRRVSLRRKAKMKSNGAVPTNASPVIVPKNNKIK